MASFRTMRQEYDATTVSGCVDGPEHENVPSSEHLLEVRTLKRHDCGNLHAKDRRKENKHFSLSFRHLIRGMTLLALTFPSKSSVRAYSDVCKPVGRPRYADTLVAERSKNSFTLRTRICTVPRMAESDQGDSTNSDENFDEHERKEEKGGHRNGSKGQKGDREKELLARLTRLEGFVARQEMEIQRLKKTCEQLSETSLEFARVIQLLRDAGMGANGAIADVPVRVEPAKNSSQTNSTERISLQNKIVESFDDTLIFGTAPTSVIEAADSAGAAILAAMLGGKQRMLVDVRDADLSRDPATLVEFIELAILPIAAGLEGLKSARNRVKIVFPKVSQLLEYRRTMALAAPEVVALSTLAFDPVDKRDKLIVILAPAPDDDEGLAAMNELLSPSDPKQLPIQQPVVILNYHMIPVSSNITDFVTAYHLRLLSVQYMSDETAQNYFQNFETDDKDGDEDDCTKDADKSASNESSLSFDDAAERETDPDDEALEAAMKHAHEVGMSQGVTRAMVIRAYPRPWHVFVDTSPGTDSDFEVAATFDQEPTQDEINFSIVECLEGSEREDEIVAQQMQEALEEGQLDRISDMIGAALEKYSEDNDDGRNLTTAVDDKDDDEDDDDEPYSDFDMFEEDSI